MTTSSTASEPSRCVQCGGKPWLYFDERLQAWDCIHICGDRCFGAMNQPTREAAVEVWNSLVKRKS